MDQDTQSGLGLHARTGCAVCGGPYVLVDDELCGECLLVTYVALPDAPEAAHVDQVDQWGGSPKYLPGWHEAWEHLHRVSTAKSEGRLARIAAEARPVRPVPKSW